MERGRRAQLKPAERRTLRRLTFGLVEGASTRSRRDGLGQRVLLLPDNGLLQQYLCACAAKHLVGRRLQALGERIEIGLSPDAYARRCEVRHRPQPGVSQPWQRCARSGMQARVGYVETELHQKDALNPVLAHDGDSDGIDRQPGR